MRKFNVWNAVYSWFDEDNGMSGTVAVFAYAALVLMFVVIVVSGA